MTEQLSEEMQTKIREFQAAQQRAGMIMSQKYQIDMQFRETTTALEELDKTAADVEVHKAVGQILIKTDKESVVIGLNEKKDSLEVRLKSLEAQEKKISDELKSLQDRLQGILPQAPVEKEEEKKENKEEEDKKEEKTVEKKAE